MFNCLPVIQRELRAAARRRSTYRVRWWSALIAIVVTMIWLAYAQVVSGSRSAGASLFAVQTWYLFALCMLSGTLLTADCLSQEKREGTLGLVLLTGLGGSDVVLGKFIGLSVHAFYSLLAILPVTGISMLLGGVTGADFWHTSLVLMNALFFSLATGMCVSAAARDAEKASAGSLIMLLFLTAGLPLLARIGVGQSWAWVSPAYHLMSTSGRVVSSKGWTFFQPLVTSHLSGWLLLAAATLILRLQLRTHRIESDCRSLSGSFALRRNTGLIRGASNVRLIAQNPVFWLTSRNRSFRVAAWAIVLACCLQVIAMLPIHFGPAPVWFFWEPPGIGLWAFLLKILIAFQACRFFIQSRQDGTLELLLITRLSDREIKRGLWLSLRRNYLWPAFVLFCLLFVPSGIQIFSSVARADAESVGWGILGLFPNGIWLLRMIADIFAVAWFGMWLSLTSPRPARAPLFTILFAVVLPSLLCWFGIFADLLLIVRSSTRLQADFRWLLNRRLGLVTVPAARVKS